MIELYDLGRTTHKAVPGMYEFIVNHADKYVSPPRASELKAHARNRETPGHSIPQDAFTEMCDIWVHAYQHGDFPIDQQTLIFPDTLSRFQKVKAKGGEIGILTSASRDFTEILFRTTLQNGQNLSDLINYYFLGEEIGDKDFPETFTRLWEKTNGGIYAIFDDKPSVCRAASEGIKQANGSARIYLVDRKNQYARQVQEELADKGIIKIASFDAISD